MATIKRMLLCSNMMSAILPLLVISSAIAESCFKPEITEQEMKNSECVIEDKEQFIGDEPDPGFNLYFTTNLQELIDVPITFTQPIPSWLRGSLIRNGFGRFEMGRHSFTHSFDAYSKINKLAFDGSVTANFSTKYLASESYNASLEIDNVAPYLLFQGVEPGFNFIQRMQQLIRGLDNMNVNIYDFYDNIAKRRRYVALNDFWKIYEIDPVELRTIAPIIAPLPGSLFPGSDSYNFLSFLSSAHPLPEAGTANHLTYVSTVSVVPGIPNVINLIRVVSPEKRELIAKWNVDRVPYMHSFSATENYAVFFACPFFVNVGKILSTARPIDSLDWYPDEATAVYVINLSTGIVSTLTTENTFIMHHVNAFEIGSDQIVIDVASYSNPDFVKALEMKTLMNPVARNNVPYTALIKRYRINFMTKIITPERFIPRPGLEFVEKLDLPTINENYRYKPYCFVYGVVLKCDNNRLANISIVKKDVCSNTGDNYWHVDNHYPSEAWFVATPGGQREDDGYLIGQILDGVNKQSYTAIIDAKTMATVSMADLPTVIPYTLHGRFFNNV